MSDEFVPLHSPMGLGQAAMLAEDDEYYGPEGWMKTKGLQFLFGKGGVGKTMMLYSVMLSLTGWKGSNRNVFGEELPDDWIPIKVLWFEAEKYGNIAQRAKKMGVEKTFNVRYRVFVHNKSEYFC